jgi:hypothetical protein
MSVKENGTYEYVYCLMIIFMDTDAMLNFFHVSNIIK